MNKFKLALLTAAFVGLFACTTTQQPKKTVKTRYLKNNISQAELNNPKDYKRYYYSCRNSETGSNSYLTTYFARLSGLIDGIPKKPAAPNAMAFTLKNAIKALARPEPIIAAKKA